MKDYPKKDISIQLMIDGDYVLSWVSIKGSVRPREQVNTIVLDSDTDEEAYQEAYFILRNVKWHDIPVVNRN